MPQRSIALPLADASGLDYDAGMTLFLTLMAFAAVAAQPPDFLVEESGDLLEFAYGWPGEVERLLRLRALLQADMERGESEAVSIATETRLQRPDSFHTQFYSKVWERAGSNAQLLSLFAATGRDTGGAHPNTTYGALLWDVGADRATEITILLGEPLARIAPRFCAALDAERARRRGEPVVANPDDAFTTCPPLAEQVLAPSDRDGNGRFDTLTALLAPYIAGPYVEGDYEIELRFQADDLAGLPAGYRPAFEVPGADFRPIPREDEETADTR